MKTWEAVANILTILGRSLSRPTSRSRGGHDTSVEERRHMLTYYDDVTLLC